MILPILQLQTQQVMSSVMALKSATCIEIGANDKILIENLKEKVK